jgi:DNA mismatch endonuclease, patch repair protein
MASIRSRDTKPEMLVRRYLHGRGFRYSLVRKDLPGQPDLVLPKFNAAVFVHGCFWHGHVGCRFATTPATRPDFWRSKLSANAARDQRVETELQQLGWRVAVVWECALRKEPLLELKRLARFLRSNQSEIVIPASPQPPK